MKRHNPANSCAPTGLVPKGVAFVEHPHPHQTQSVLFVLMPQFSMAAFSAAIEPLRIANQLTGKPLYRWELASEDGCAVKASNGVLVSVDAELGDTPRDAIIFACSGVEPQRETSKTIADWLRAQWRNGRRVGGLCTGAYALAKAGILGGKKFTLHWENIPAFKEIFPDLNPIEQLYAIDNRILTCAGGSAATDLFLRLIQDEHGTILARSVLNMCLIPIHREEADRQKQPHSSLIGTRNLKLNEIVTYFEENLEESIDLDHVGAIVGISRRQMERLFKKYSGTTPRGFLLDMRLQRGRELLAGTNLSVAEVAAAVGFSGSTHFSKRYREKFGNSPHRPMGG